MTDTLKEMITAGNWLGVAEAITKAHVVPKGKTVSEGGDDRFADNITRSVDAALKIVCPCCEQEVKSVRNCGLCGNFKGCSSCQSFHQEVRHFSSNSGPSSDTQNGMELDRAKGD